MNTVPPLNSLFYKDQGASFSSYLQTSIKLTPSVSCAGNSAAVDAQEPDMGKS